MRDLPAEPLIVRVRGSAGKLERVILGPKGHLGFPDTDLPTVRAWDAMTGRESRVPSILDAWRDQFEDTCGGPGERTIPRVLRPALHQAFERHTDRWNRRTLPYKSEFARRRDSQHPELFSDPWARLALRTARYRRPDDHATLGFRGRHLVIEELDPRTEHTMTGQVVGRILLAGRYWHPNLSAYFPHDVLVIRLALPPDWRRNVLQPRRGPLVDGCFIFRWTERGAHDTTNAYVLALKQWPDRSLTLERAMVTPERSLIWLTDHGKAIAEPWSAHDVVMRQASIAQYSLSA